MHMTDDIMHMCAELYTMEPNRKVNIDETEKYIISF